MKPFINWLAAGAGVAGAALGANAAATWLRYGRPRRAHGDAADPLLDSFMPAYDVCERHCVAVAAPAEVTFAAAKTVDISDSRIIRAIFRARELIMRGAPIDPPARPRGMVDGMTALGWAVLAEVPGREIVLGAATQPWRANPAFRPLTASDFVAFAEPDFVKIVWTLRADPQADGSSMFRSETRAVATDAGAAKKFRRYWALLSPGIALIRRAMLPAVVAAADRAWRIEGDDLVPEPRGQLTHATTIDAPPADVWPWLVQMGCQRAGWYSWDVLDNGRVRSADHIIPELQHLAIGDVLPARPVGDVGFEVLRIIPDRALVLRGLSPDWPGTWAFVLEPLGANRTRLVTRYRAGLPANRSTAMMMPVWSAVHRFMETKQLRTIKHHAEHMPKPRPPAGSLQRVGKDSGPASISN